MTPHNPDDRRTAHRPDLERFVQAQAPVYDEVLAELREGHKQTHWMWFIFPQLLGLAHSATAKRFGITDLDEARAYLHHPVLGPRLRQCFELLLTHPSQTPQDMLGGIDGVKLRSSATLFLLASGNDSLFAAVLATFYAGVPDPLTVDLLSR